MSLIALARNALKRSGPGRTPLFGNFRSSTLAAVESRLDDLHTKQSEDNSGQHKEDSLPGLLKENFYGYVTAHDTQSLCKSKAWEASSRGDKATSLIKTVHTEKDLLILNTLASLKDSKEALYGALDACVALEFEFPLRALRRALIVLEQQEQWHRIVQVIKWMLSKGQGATQGIYEQLVRALNKDERAEEAHILWETRISQDLHSTSWRFCDLMLSIYFQNSMHERAIKLFEKLEALGRKPPKISTVKKIAVSYELLDLHDEQKRVLEKYKFKGSRFRKSTESRHKKIKR